LLFFLQGGGWLSAEATTLTVSNTAIKNSRATLGGGGVINAMGSKIELNSVSVIKAFAAASGGALSLRLCRATIKQSVFRECHSLKSGGAILLSTRSQCTLTKTSFETITLASSKEGLNLSMSSISLNT